MKITKLDYFPYELILKTPFKNSKNEISRKKIYYIELTFEDGETYLGESTLSPELGTENEQEFFRAIKNLKSEIENKPIDIIKETNAFAKYEKYPAMQFGISQCIFNKRFDKEKNEYPDDFFARVVRVNAVIDLSPIEQCVSLAKKYAAEGFKTIKIKIGRKNFDDDFELIKLIREQIGNNINLRLDANEKWKDADALPRLKKLEKFKIDFVEQPIKNYKKMNLLAQESPICIGWDKSLGKKFFLMDLVSERIDFFVIKPLLYGNVIRIYNKFYSDNLTRLKIIISSTFESCVGRSLLVLLASILNNDLCHGLNTGEFISNEMFNDPYKVKNGKIDFDINKYPPKFVTQQ